MIEEYKAIIEGELGSPFPQDPKEQLWGAIGAVFASWMNQRAITYRRLHGIPASWGTAVNVQTMVFGNFGDNSATGVAFTRNPSTGDNALYGEFLVNAQGEDVVAGIRTPQDITEAARIAAGSSHPSLETEMPKAFAEFNNICKTLERHYRDMQDVEFTIERGKLWMLQARTGKRTAKAALKIAVDMADEGLIDRNEAVLRIDPAGLDQLLHPTIDPDAQRDLIATGLPASPGAASGEIVFSSDEAETLAQKGRKVILVRIETSPEDINGMHAAQGILTCRGGMTSHAAVVARGMGKPCVSGAGGVRVDYQGETMSAGGRVLKKGDDHHHRRGERRGVRRRHRDAPAGAVGRFLAADGMGGCGAPAQGQDQRGDADRRARGALVRGGGDRPLPHRAHVLRGRPHRRGARDDPRRQRGGAAGGARQAAADAAGRLRRAVRDHEGPAGDDPPARSAAARVPAQDRRRDRRGRQSHGGRSSQGCASGCSPCRRPTRCSATAVAGWRSPTPRSPRCRRAPSSRRRSRSSARIGQPIVPEVMVPLVAVKAELDLVKGLIDKAAAAVAEERGVKPRYQVGTMIELPRAAIEAGKIAESAEFFSFGTNDLTQTTYGISRDDAANFIGAYTDAGVFPNDPFVTIDRDGVGELVRMAAERGRATRAGIKLGICGEHGGDPASIAFCEEVGLDYVSCSPFRVPIARLAAAQAALRKKGRQGGLGHRLKFPQAVPRLAPIVARFRRPTGDPGAIALSALTDFQG